MKNFLIKSSLTLLCVFLLGAIIISNDEPYEPSARDAFAAGSDIMKGKMLAPSQSDVPDTGRFFKTRDDGKYHVGGYIDAPNRFGMKLRKSWQMVLEYKGDKVYRSTWYSFDGESPLSIPKTLAEMAADEEKAKKAEALELAAIEQARLQRIENLELKIEQEKRKIALKELREAKKKESAEKEASRLRLFAFITKNQFRYDSVTISGSRYEKVKVTSASDRGLHISHAVGARTIPFSKVPKEWKHEMGIPLDFE